MAIKPTNIETSRFDSEDKNIPVAWFEAELKEGVFYNLELLGLFEVPLVPFSDKVDPEKKKTFTW